MTIALLLVLLSTHVSSSFAPAEDARTAQAHAAAPREDAPLVVRSYDISSAVPWQGEGRTGAILFPLLVPNGNEFAPTPVGGSGAEILIERIQTLYSAEFESLGRFVMLDQRERLVVRAPEEVHLGIVKLLGFLESAFAPTCELTIDVVQLPNAPSPLPSSVLTAADADKLLASLGKRATYRMRVRPGAAGTIDVTSQQDLVVDYNAEVAQAATILDPVVDAVRTGLQLEARAAPAPGGTWLALAMRDAQPVGEIRSVNMAYRTLVVAQEQNLGAAAPRNLQAMCIDNRSFALNTFLPEGKVLAVQTGIDVQDRKSGVLVCIRAAGKAPPRELRFAIEGLGPQGEVRALQSEFALPPRLKASMGTLFPEHEGGMHEIENLMLGGVSAAVMYQWAFDPADFLVDQMRTDDSWTIRDWGPWLFTSRDAGAGPADPKAEDAAVVLARLAPSPRLFQLAFTLRRTGAASAAVARATLPARLGESNAIVLCTEQHRVCEYNVEVAQNAAIADPVVYDSFDGLMLVAEPDVGITGDATLVVTAMARVQRGETREFDPQATTIGKIEQATFDRLVVRDKLVFPKEGGPRTIQLGDANGSSGALVLDVEMTEVR